MSHAATTPSIATDRAPGSRWSDFAQGIHAMTQNFDLSKGVVPIVLVIGMLGAVGAGSWWAAGISRDIQELSTKLEPLTGVSSEISDNRRELEIHREEIRKLERDLAVANSRIHHLSVAVGVQEKLKEMDLEK